MANKATVETTKPDLASQVDALTKAVDSIVGKLSAPSNDNKSAITKAFSTTGRADPNITVHDPNVDPRGGFKSFNHFCHDVMMSERPGGSGITKTMAEWRTKAVSGMSESVGADGGFLVPPEFATEIWARTYDNPLLAKCKSYTVGGNSMVFPYIDETSRAQGSQFGGARAYWEAEANQFTSTKPRLGRMELVLKKLISLCYATDELMQDSQTPLQQWLMGLFAQVIAFKIGDSIIRGTGAGIPQGVLNAASLVTVSKEVGQAATTIIFENITKMWQRMYAPSRANAVWLINQDIEHQLSQLALNIGTAGTAAYMPAGGLSDSPYAKLMGREVIPVEFCSTLGTVGDILLVDLSQYYVLRKGETQTESSIHLRFDFAETAFRTIFRMDGKCIWPAALTPANGTNTLSPLVALETRS